MNDAIPSQQDVHRSYDPDYFAPLFAIEDRHFWFRARNEIIAAIVSQITARLGSGYKVLEVGCGTGNVLRVLEQVCQRGIVVGMDIFAHGLEFAHKRTSCALVQGDILSLPFGSSFELIGLFDILEHLPDDLRALRDLHRILAKEGMLVLTVPAHLSLWSYFDNASDHYRRYEITELRNKLKRAGYRVEYITQYMASIFPLVWLKRRLATLANQSSPDDANIIKDLALAEFRIVPLFNELLAFLLVQEIHVIMHRRRLPIGTSLLCMACKE